MLRSTFLQAKSNVIATRRRASSLTVVRSISKQCHHRSCTPSSSLSQLLLRDVAPLETTTSSQSRYAAATIPTNCHPRSIVIRAASSSSGEQKNATADAQSEQSQSPPPTSQEIVLTPGEKVVATTRLFFWTSALAFASVCAYYIGKELSPTKMSPNAVFDSATSTIRENAEIQRRFGTFKTYGRDHGGHREGRRNFVEHTEYNDEEDGSRRTRVRFNLEGQYGNAFVFAEVSKDMPKGEFVYILVQDKRNGQVITVCDNRSALRAKRLAGGSAEGNDVFATLLGGGKKS